MSSEDQKRERERSPELQRSIEEFHRRSKDMNDAERQAAVDQLIEEIVDRAATVAPPALRAKVREQIAEMVRNDPTIRLMVEDVRRTAKS